MASSPRVTVFLGISLDGYLARDDHSLDWLNVVQTDPPEDTGYADLMASADVLVMGRATYDVVTAFPEWPFTGKRVVVLTHRPLDGQHHEEGFQGALVDLVERLAREGHRHIYLDGGDAVRQALRAGLVTDMTLSWVPVVLGSGIALFGRDLPERRWRLVSSRAFPSGLVQATYAAHTEGD
ncbi:dihydrofolate reductase family protein [Deinococcus maricopensis]|uniref:Bifunctional deaminase-reductase domain protein n=1 Tax=Deinococcus maricopensis (strain DSM 21211 / LMG 22137 / NRRL B-23946 / LB-34) TaxID=709986 RepID=E8U420_DEIML|nr:dihydrofolate reductase family protein [Deinococcus maricopensis]ADV65857.1 bifunctional deaminase-reductase domain protein [Deinococcus maricopensis DSM 21211]